MSYIRKKQLRNKRRALRTKSRLARSGMQVRIAAFKSRQHIYAQLIDDAAQKTLASCSSLQKKFAGAKSDVARLIGKDLAQQAKAIGIERAIFDRGRFLYHGRIEQLAQGLREGGLVL